MFFKRVELIGFKSFATKTVCDLLPGTTVIVGPNGCGKSNILDAIKWVLGETAASQMRGKKMQDVIFAGSASFKALGVAQVTVTIDNRARLLPLDYEEIQVTRRLFRSGESEYLINKTPCRMRDVHDLFLGTGVGKSAYSILEQGRVDQIINAKPIERRYLIEEAAGISKFKARKLEALRKLERTDIDLARLNDLLGEVERQVNSLKRQASKAERYKALHDACRQSEQELLVVRSRDLRRRSGELQGQLDTVKDRLTALRTELDTRAAAEEEARTLEEELTERLTDDNQALFDLKSTLSTCQHQITRLNDQIAGHARRIEQIEAEFRELNVRAGEIELRLQEADERLVEGERVLASHCARHEELRRHYAALEQTVSERTRMIEALATEVVALREAVSRADNEMRLAQALVERQSETRREAEAALAALETALHGHEAAHQELTLQAAILGEEIARLQGEVTGGKEAQAARQKALVGHMTELDKVSRQLHESASRLETLNELKTSYEGYYQGVREVMLAADRGEIRGILGVAPNLIAAAREHEVAIEVALATHLQDIVTQTADDAKAAIEYLKRWGRGRCTFLPLDRLEAAPLHPCLHEVLGRRGVLGIAAKLVNYDRQIDTAVQFLLGTTIVVEDLDVGLELGRQGYRGRYVSLDGQLINPAGSMTGGRIQATGLMTREREIRDLGEAVGTLTARQAELKAQIERVQMEMAAQHAKLEAAQSALDQQRLEQTRLLKDVEAAGRARDAAAHALAERRENIGRIDDEVAEKREAIEHWRAEFETKSARLAECDARLADERQQARHQNDDFINLSTALAEARAEMENARQRITDARQQRERARADGEAIERQRENRQREIESFKAEDALLEEQIARIRKEMEDATVEHETIHQRLAAEQTEREAVMIRLKELATEVERLTRDERVVDNEYRELELRQAELRAHLDNLNEQAAEKFAVSLEDLAEALGAIEKDPHALAVEVTEMRDKLEKIGPVNMAALEEYQQQSERLAFLQDQHKDLTQAKEQLSATIAKLNDTTRQLFHETFTAVREHFVEMFRRLFNGGKADLILDAPEGLDPLLDGGIEIFAQPPGKKLQSITLLSGGEKAMTAIAMLFGLFLCKPSPFCILDEIDAPLDDVNIERFKTVLREFNKTTQFIVITHNKITMELADAIYGVTMEESGVSKLVSVRFEEAEEMVDAV